MKRLFLCLCLALALGGCASSPQWDKTEIEGKIQTTYNERLKANGKTETCTEVQLVPDGENKFTGFAKFSDGSEKDVIVNLDPDTGEFIAG